MLPSQNIFIVHRFANTFRGHVSCSQELEDCEQKRVNINCFYPFYNLAFSFTFISFLLLYHQFSGWMDTWVSTRQEELGITRPPPEFSKPTKNNRYGRRPSGLLGWLAEYIIYYILESEHIVQIRWWQWWWLPKKRRTLAATCFQSGLNVKSWKYFYWKTLFDKIWDINPPTERAPRILGIKRLWYWEIWNKNFWRILNNFMGGKMT